MKKKLSAPIEILKVGYYAWAFSVCLRTAYKLYERDLKELQRKFKGKTVMHIQGRITNYGFLWLYERKSPAHAFHWENLA